MLFDLMDYVSVGIIGPNQVPMTSTKWEDMKTTAAATREAFQKAIGEYISSANRAVSPCSDKLTELLQQRMDTYSAYVTAFDIFWDALIADTATAQQYADYNSTLDAYMKALRSIMSILDGDKFKIID